MDQRQHRVVEPTGRVDVRSVVQGADEQHLVGPLRSRWRHRRRVHPVGHDVEVLGRPEERDVGVLAHAHGGHPPGQRPLPGADLVDLQPTEGAAPACRRRRPSPHRQLGLDGWEFDHHRSDVVRQDLLGEVATGDPGPVERGRLPGTPASVPAPPTRGGGPRRASRAAGTAGASPVPGGQVARRPARLVRHGVDGGEPIGARERRQVGVPPVHDQQGHIVAVGQAGGRGGTPAAPSP